MDIRGLNHTILNTWRIVRGPLAALCFLVIVLCVIVFVLQFAGAVRPSVPM